MWVVWGYVAAMGAGTYVMLDAIRRYLALWRFYRAWQGFALMDHMDGDGDTDTEERAALRARMALLQEDRRLRRELRMR